MSRSPLPETPTHERLRALTRRLAREEAGTIALWFGLALPALLLLCGMAIDFGRYQQQRQSLHAATDAAALAAAKELSLTDARRNDLGSVAKAVIERRMNARSAHDLSRPVVVDTSLAEARIEVTVRANHTFEPLFGNVARFLPDQITARSVARVVGSPNVCVLALEPNELGAILLAKSARMTGDGCSVFSNSSSMYGLLVRDSAELKAQSICSAGGVEQGGTISPPAIADCPQFDDPLASRPAPVSTGCTHNDVVIKDQTVTLSPGVYCGGLRIEGSSQVTLETGEYIIQNGILSVSGSAVLQGDYVSFYLGTSSWMYFGTDTTVKLSAMKTGVMAGLLFFGARDQSKLITHTMLSRNAQTLVGTIYLPRNSFIIDGDAAVGGSSAYTAIVARRLVLLAGPHLVLNSNYDQTDVPVPEGIRGAAQPVRLVE